MVKLICFRFFFSRFQQYYDYEFTNCYTFNGAWGNNKFLEKAVVFNPVTGKSTGTYVFYSLMYHCFFIYYYIIVS